MDGTTVRGVRNEIMGKKEMKGWKEEGEKRQKQFGNLYHAVPRVVGLMQTLFTHSVFLAPSKIFVFSSRLLRKVLCQFRALINSC